MGQCYINVRPGRPVDKLTQRVYTHKHPVQLFVHTTCTCTSNVICNNCTRKVSKTVRLYMYLVLMYVQYMYITVYVLVQVGLCLLGMIGCRSETVERGRWAKEFE